MTNHPTLTDCAVFGLLGPFCASGMKTPVCEYAASKPNLCKWVKKVTDKIAA